MTEALKCPDCSAPLEYPANGGPTMRCPYCNATVLLPGSPQPVVMQPNQNPNLGTMVGQAMELAEVARALRAGNKIEAIRLYRKMFGVDLATAKNAVEKYAAHQQIGNFGAPNLNYGGPDPSQAASYAMKAGCGITAGILLLVGMILVFVFLTVQRKLASVSTRAIPSPVITVPRPVKVAPLAPVVPGYARMVLEFGSEGIGAGQFKDSRSIATDNQGHFYVGEYSDGRIQAFDPHGKFISAWSIGHGQSLLSLTADRHGNVYAVVPGHIYRYEGVTGKRLGEVETVHNDDVQEYYSDAFAALDGDLYAMGNNSNVVDIDAEGHIKRTLNLVEKVGESVSFDKLIVIATGEIYALEREKGIFKFAPDGRYINRFGGGGSGRVRVPGRLFSPKSLAADGKGRIYVSDSNRTVQVFDEDGNYIDSFGGTEIAFGLAITDQNEIYACVRNRCVIRKYVLEKQ